MPLGFGTVLQGLGGLVGLLQGAGGEDPSITRYRQRGEQALEKDWMARQKLIAQMKQMAQTRGAWGGMGGETFDPLRAARGTLHEQAGVAPQIAGQISGHEDLVRKLRDQLDMMKLQQERGAQGLFGDVGALFGAGG